MEHMRLCKSAGSLTVFIAKKDIFISKIIIAFHCSKCTISKNKYCIVVHVYIFEMYNNYEMQQYNSRKKKSVLLGEINVK